MQSYGLEYCFIKSCGLPLWWKMAQKPLFDKTRGRLALHEMPPFSFPVFRQLTFLEWCCSLRLLLLNPPSFCLSSAFSDFLFNGHRRFPK